MNFFSRCYRPQASVAALTENEPDRPPSSRALQLQQRRIRINWKPTLESIIEDGDGSPQSEEKKVSWKPEEFRSTAKERSGKVKVRRRSGKVKVRSYSYLQMAFNAMDSWAFMF